MPDAFRDLLLGSLLPPVIDIINAKIVDSRARFWISVIISIVVGALFNLREFKAGDPNEFIASIVTVFVSAQAVYKKLYEDSKLQNKVRTTVNEVL